MKQKKFYQKQKK